MPGRDRSDLRTAEEASAGQWVIVPAFSIRVALRRGNRALLTRPRSARFPQEQLSVRVVDEFGVFQGRGKHLPFQAMLRTQTGDCLLACGGVWVAKRGLLVAWVGFIGVGLDTAWR